MRNLVCENCNSENLVSLKIESDSYEANRLCVSCYCANSTEDNLLEKLSEIHFSGLEYFNYSNNEFLKNIKKNNNLGIRFISPLKEFDFAKFQSYFFINGHLYIVSNKLCYADYDIRRTLKGTIYYKHIEPFYYVFKAIYAGRNTEFIDDCGKGIYTGDILRFLGAYSDERKPHKYFKKDRLINKDNPHLNETFGVVSSYGFCPEAFQVAIDNSGAFLCHASELEILGNIFYDLTPNKRIDIWKEACAIGANYDGFWNKHSVNSLKEDFMKIKTPSFIKMKIEKKSRQGTGFLKSLMRMLKIS